MVSEEVRTDLDVACTSRVMHNSRAENAEPLTRTARPSATAIALAEEGCNLLLADRQRDELDAVAAACHEASGGDISVRPCLCDVADKSQVHRAVREADEVALEAATSSPSSVASILVNCAGITRDSTVSNISDEAWNDVLSVNLTGTFLACQAFCEPGRLNKLLLGDDPSRCSTNGVGGSIVNIGSIVSSYGNVGQVNYAASKGGVVGLTRSLAKEMALFSWKAASAVDSVGGGGGNRTDVDEGDGIVPPTVRVNCIQPGFIATPMAHAVPEKILSEMKRKVALRRLGRAEDVANLALFLASTERSGYITGESFECSGMLRL